jgi:Integrase zinc binding domain
VAAIRQFPRPTTVRDLQAFLGLFNFYRRFVPAAAAILWPLTDALAGSSRGSTVVVWDSGRLVAFGGCLVDFRDIAAAQAGCPDCQRAMASPSLRVVQVEVDGWPLLVDISSGVMRPLVPQQFRRRIFDAVHGLAHPGTRATKRLISSRYLWPELAAEVTSWCRNCQCCQRAKVTTQPAAAVQPIQVPTVRFSHVNLDLVGPLPCTTEGFTHLLTAIDRSI